MLRSAVFGATLPFRALRLILAKPQLLFWSAFPLVVTLGLYFWLMRRLEAWVDVMISSELTALHIDPHGGLGLIVSFVAGVITLVFCAITFSISASLIASPFNDRLAEHAERWGEPPLPPAPRPRPAVRLRLIAIDGAKSICALLAGVVFLLLSWVPGLNLLALAALCFVVTFQYISYPQTRRGQGLGAGLFFLARYPFASLGFGATLSALFAIPLVSCLAVPLAVVGGTLLVARARAGRLF